MPKCVIITDDLYHTGGVTSVIFAQIKSMSSLGWSMFLFGMYGPVDENVKKFLSGYGYVVDKSSKRNKFREIWNNDANEKLDNFLKDIVDENTVAHIHSFSLGLTPSITRSISKYNLKYVITAHDAGWACPTGYQYNFKTKKFCNLKPLSLSCIKSNCDKKKPIHKAYKVIKLLALDYFSDIKINAKKIYVPSEWLGKNISSRFPSNAKIEVLLNPVSVNKKDFKFENRDYFLFIGRLWEEKGIDKFLNVAAKSFPIKVVGDGGLKKQLEKQFPNVEFLGMLQHEQALEFLSNAKALVLPSVYLESFGLVVAEALSNGVPVIVSRSVGAISLVKQKVNGFIVDMDEPQTLLEACNLLMNDNISKKMSINAYELYWKNPLTEMSYAEILNEDLNEILNNP